MQRQVVYCDLCGAADVPSGHPTLSVGGDRGSAVRSQLPNARNPLDLCDTCAIAFVTWAKSRVPQAEPTSTPPAQPQSAAPEHTTVTTPAEHPAEPPHEG